MKKAMYTLLLISVFTYTGYSQMVVDTTYSAEDIVKNILIGNENIKIGNINYRGHKRSIGVFDVDTSSFPIPRGLILSNGEATSAVGPNTSSNYSDQLNYGGDKDLRIIAKKPTYDAAVLEFDFIPLSNRISFNYIFASEEYPEFVGSSYNDVFAFYISGPSIDGTKNLATIPGTDDVVAINSVNPLKNKSYYIDNNYWGINGKKISLKRQEQLNEKLLKTIEYDGLTTVLTSTINVIPYQKYHLKIALSDVTDMVYNSAVFLEGGSFSADFDENAAPEFMVKTPMNIEKIDFDAILEGKIDPSANLKRKNVEKEPEAKKIIEEPTTIAIKEKATTKIAVVTNIIKLKPILFNSNSYNINQLDDLQKVTVFLFQNSSYHAYLYGHTDNDGNTSTNQQLSQNRVKAIKQYLVKEGIAEERIHIYAYGESQPIADNKTENGKAKNRRVEVFIRQPF